MKKLAFFLFAVCLTRLAFSQSPDTLMMPDEECRELYNKVYRAYVQDPDNVAGMVDLANFYAMGNNPKRNLCLAIKYVTQAEARYMAMVADESKYKEVSRLIRKKITVATVREQKQAILESTRAYLRSSREMTSEELDNIAESFSAYPDILRLVEGHRLNLIFQEAKRTNTLEAYYSFATRYPSTSEAEECELAMGRLAKRQFAELQTVAAVDAAASPYLSIASVSKAAQLRKGTLAYNEARRQHTVEGYRAFLSKHPYASEYEDALDMLDELKEEEYASLRSSEELSLFAKSHPGNPLAEKALSQLRHRIRVEQDIPTLELYLKLFPLDSAYVDIYRQYYDWVSAEGNKEPLVRFKEAHPDFPYMRAVDEDIFQAERIDSVNLMEPFAEEDFRANATKVYKLTGKDISFVGLQRILKRQIAAREWSAVLERLDFFDLCFEDWANDKYRALIQLIQAPTDTKKVATLGCGPVYDMLHPQVGPDGRLYYTRKEGSNMTVCVAEKDAKDVWHSVGNVVFTNGENRNMQFYSLYANGQRMLVGRDGDILMAVKEGRQWTLEPILDTTVNSRYYEGDAFMLPDQSGMLFCSDRPGGHNFQSSGAYFHGDTALATDLYYVPLTKRGWGEAVNLGIAVNTSCCERSPLLSKDMKTLYFVSDGHVGLGYGDIFTATRTDIDDWSHWSTPVNYGKETNTGSDEATLSFSTDEKTLYYSSNQRGRYAFFHVAATHQNRGGFQNVTISTDGATADLHVIDLSRQTEVGFYEQADETPKTLSLYSGKTFVVRVSNAPHYVPSVMMRPSQQASLVVPVSVQKELVNLECVAFEDGKTTLMGVSEEEIELLADWVKSHPDQRIEVILHVDGDDDQQCFQLSRRRSEVIRKILEINGLNDSMYAISSMGNLKAKHDPQLPQVQVRFLEK